MDPNTKRSCAVSPPRSRRRALALRQAGALARPAAITLAIACASVALAPAGDAARRVTVLKGRTGEHERIALTIAGGRVRRVALTVRRYRCERFGDIGPLRIVRRPGSPIGHRGRIAVFAGPPAERLELHARLRHGRRLRGHFRLRGTIALGERCRSRRVRFAARRPGARDRAHPSPRARHGPRRPRLAG